MRSFISKLSRGVAIIATAFAAALLGTGPASAGVGGAAGPTWPAVLAIGNPVSAYIDIVNASDGANAVENVDVLLITFTPSCSAQTAGVCTTPDPGVFTLTSIAIGDPSSSCKDTLFTLVGPTPGGIFTLSPNKAVHLGPADGSGGLANPRRCRILLGGVVAKLPVDSSLPNPPITTIQFARAVLRGAVSQAVGAASGQATVAITTINDMVIAKTDGVSSINVGGSTTYTVTVTNNGPSPANGAIVKDPFAAGLSKTAAQCIGTTGGAVCPGTVTTALLEGAGVVIPTFPTASTVTFTVSANLTALSGTVKNLASVTAAVGSLNPGTSCTTLPDPNSRTFSGGVCTAGDLDTVAGADLVISKTNGVLSVNAGTSTTYTVVVTNPGPSAANGATVTDPAVAGLSKTAAACLGATAGAACPASTTAGELEAGVVIPTFPAGSTVTFTVTATVTAGSGTVKNSASVTPPAGLVNPGTSCTTLPDPNSRNFAANVCTAGDQDNVSAVSDLFISKSTTAQDYLPGDIITYTVVVANNGPSPAIGVGVADTKPTQITTWTWVCDPPATGGATGCSPAAASASNFTDTIDLPSGSTISYTVTATVSGSATGDIVNKATATPPVGTTNPGTGCVTSLGITRSFNDPTTGACSSTVTLGQGLGIGGGHFDFDIYYSNSTTLNTKWTKQHIHQWDNKWNVTGVNMLNPSDADFNLSEAQLVTTTTPVKVIVINQYLNPAAFLAVGPGDFQLSVHDYPRNLNPANGLGSLAEQANATDAAALINAMPSYQRGSTLERLIVNMPKTAFNSINWWGAGGDVRAGVIPTQTGCVNSITALGQQSGSNIGPFGERHDGALTIQVIKGDVTYTGADLEQNASNDIRNGFRIKNSLFTTYVLAEFTVFWHHPDHGCYRAFDPDDNDPWLQNPEMEDESGTPDPRPTGTADPTGPIPPNPSVAP